MDTHKINWESNEVNGFQGCNTLHLIMQGIAKCLLNLNSPAMRFLLFRYGEF